MPNGLLDVPGILVLAAVVVIRTRLVHDRAGAFDSVRTDHRPGRQAVRVGSRRLRLLTAFVLAVWMVLPTSSASGFGTIDSGGQHREHERITRAALSCAGADHSDVHCFQPRSIDFLAGHDHEFGAVGAPDSDEISVPA